MTFFQIAVFTKGNNLVLSVNELSPTSHLVIHRQVAATAKSLPNCSLGIAIHVTAVSHLYSTVGQVSRLFVYTYLHFFRTLDSYYKRDWSVYHLTGYSTAIR